MMMMSALGIPQPPPSRPLTDLRTPNERECGLHEQLALDLAALGNGCIFLVPEFQAEAG